MKKRFEYLVEIFNELPNKAQILIFESDNNAISILDEVALQIYNLESPIEKIMFVALTKCFYEKKIYLYAEAQKKIKCGEKNYYADITIEYDNILNWFLKEDFKLVIECDGYDFHQKTKEQVEYDNKREYDLKIEGYEILRFSGREIFNDPMECARKVIKFIGEKNKE